MPEPRRALRAEERLAELRRAKAKRRTERLQRELAGPAWHRMVRLVPISLRFEGALTARALRADRAAITDALRDDAVFALDTAMRLSHGYGFFANDDVQAYLTSPAPLDRLASAGLLSAEPHPDLTLLRPWPGPPRLLACVASELPACRVVGAGYRVVTPERLARELVGAVGRRADLFALFERAERG
ncbi:MAG TPA: hypothetical protein VFS43_26470 [Polyangiaceae bacterium]|nr:hypothetical protein [Polyangiaceae bacterium]